jgi:HPt (histidine-containing phosphotransfer) domain-containing protein
MTIRRPYPKQPNLCEGETMDVKPYGLAIQQAIASGDVAKMKAVARQAEQHLKEHGNVPAALEALKIEIAKLAKPKTK